MADPVMSAAVRLGEAERACHEIERQIWLRPRIYRKRVEAAMADWNRANVALFDAMVSEGTGRHG